MPPVSLPGPPGYPPSMASFHSVLASLSAYRPPMSSSPSELQADYAALLRVASLQHPPRSPTESTSSEDMKARFESSALELRNKAREFELKQEVQDVPPSEI